LNCRGSRKISKAAEAEQYDKYYGILYRIHATFERIKGGISFNLIINSTATHTAARGLRVMHHTILQGELINVLFTASKIIKVG
jgi:hypothetical protein